jgi:hypothetical protein
MTIPCKQCAHVCFSHELQLTHFIHSGHNESCLTSWWSPARVWKIYHVVMPVLAGDGWCYLSYPSTYTVQWLPLCQSSCTTAIPTFQTSPPDQSKFTSGSRVTDALASSYSRQKEQIDAYPELVLVWCNYLRQAPQYWQEQWGKPTTIQLLIVGSHFSLQSSDILENTLSKHAMNHWGAPKNTVKVSIMKTWQSESTTKPFFK